uniref:Peptidase A1 domain-containing protein n=1 Tax=Ditylenchus dipsaci TaxID=166011 RepID=A0A915E8H0_9BILA
MKHVILKEIAFRNNNMWIDCLLMLLLGNAVYGYHTSLPGAIFDIICNFLCVPDDSIKMEANFIRLDNTLSRNSRSYLFNNLLVANVSVGKPGRNHRMLLDFMFGDNTLVFVVPESDPYSSTSTNKSLEQVLMDKEQSHLPNDSITFENTNHTFLLTNLYFNEPTKNFANTTSNSVNLKMSNLGPVVQSLEVVNQPFHPLHYMLQNTPIDGVLSFSTAARTFNNDTSFVHNVLDKSTSSLLSHIFIAKRRAESFDYIWGRRCNSLLLRSLDLLQPFKGGKWSFLVDTILIGRGRVTVEFNGFYIPVYAPAALTPTITSIVGPRDQVDIIAGRVGAVNVGVDRPLYTVPCHKVDRHLNIVFNLRGGAKVALTTKDFVVEDPEQSGNCMLMFTYTDAKTIKGATHWLLGASFLNSYCAQLKGDKIGFAQSV